MCMSLRVVAVCLVVLMFSVLARPRVKQQWELDVKL